MWFLGIFLLYHVVSTQALIALINVQAAHPSRSYLGNSRLCHQWNCVNEKLNLTDSLPLKEKYLSTIISLLPEEWHPIGQSAVEACYGNRTKKYTNTCPGQNLMHCIVDRLVENCPDTHWNKDDGCASVSSLAAYNYMFSQSRYNNLEENLPTERRPSWFLKNYFNSKCCDLPPMFSASLKWKECGFNKFTEYHIHNAQKDRPFRFSLPSLAPPTTTTELVMNDSGEDWDPLECCSLNGFIEDSWRNECHFELSWDVNKRIGFIDVSSHLPPTTTTEKVNILRTNDVKMVPFTCDKETCVFKELNIINGSGAFDSVAFTKLLDNFTDSNPEWSKAKARVLTQCLNDHPRTYDGECNLNKILQCTFDVLTENCPNAPTEDPCKKKSAESKNVICQISGGKYSPRYRRQFCSIPNFVSARALAQCGVTSLATLQHVPQYEKTISSHKWENHMNCQQLTPPTTCVLNKMGVLSKYGFVDYFKMKNSIRSFSAAPLYELYFSVFLTTPLYRGYCSSAKKLLNLIDFMVMTCPASKRRSEVPKCRQMFHELNTSVPHDMSRIQLDQIFRNMHDAMLSQPPTPSPVHKHKSYYKTNKVYDFAMFGAGGAPPVRTIDVEPSPKTLVVLPVYQRGSNKTTGFPINSLQSDGIYRS